VSDKPLHGSKRASRHAAFQRMRAAVAAISLDGPAGLDPDGWKPMTVSDRVREIDSDRPGASRVLLRHVRRSGARAPCSREAHRKTSHDVKLARDRFRALLKKRAEDAKKK
jgi:hypothetical protein